jgi:hypothetical protein
VKLPQFLSARSRCTRIALGLLHLATAAIFITVTGSENTVDTYTPLHIAEVTFSSSLFGHLDVTLSVQKNAMELIIFEGLWRCVCFHELAGFCEIYSSSEISALQSHWEGLAVILKKVNCISFNCAVLPV